MKDLEWAYDWFDCKIDQKSNHPVKIRQFIFRKEFSELFLFEYNKEK